MADTQLAVRDSGALASAEYGHDKIELIKRTIAKGVTDDELQLFVAQCKRTRLDPFARQIYAVKRWDSAAGRNVMQTQTSIDGLRLIAERTGKYVGQVGPFWCGSDGEWHDVWLDTEPPAASKVGALRSDFKEALWGVARYGAYVQTKEGGYPNSMWTRMPDVMLAKCAEALALRKAFPQELSGLYTGEEMGQAEESGTKQAANAGYTEAQREVLQNKGVILDAPKEIAPARPWKTFKQMVDVFGQLKDRMKPYTTPYYQVLEKHGVKHANEFKSVDAATAAHRDLLAKVDEYERMKHAPAVPFEATDEDLPDILQGEAKE